MIKADHLGRVEEMMYRFVGDVGKTRPKLGVHYNQTPRSDWMESSRVWREILLDSPWSTTAIYLYQCMLIPLISISKSLNLIKKSSIFSRGYRFITTSSMADNLHQSLASLGIGSLPSIPAAHLDQNPLDVYRSHIAERLASLAGVSPDAVFAGLDRSTKPETGDFVLAVPRLRIKDAKPDVLAAKWQSQVTSSKFTPHSLVWRVSITRKGCCSRIIYAIFHFK